MASILRWLIVLGVLGFGTFWFVTAPTTLSSAEAQALTELTGDAARGEPVFWAAGCASCHAADGAQGADKLVLSGGQAFASDFGTFRAPNISSDPENGIGGWSIIEFANAMQHGVSPDGSHYYPAFPYPAYSLADAQDIADLFAFLRGLPASASTSLPHDVGFPFSIRRLVGGWNRIYLRDDFAVSGAVAPDVARGRYLVEALGHCAECHTPRSALGGLERTAWMTGAPNPSGSGRIPALTPDVLLWSDFEIAAYLSDGFTPDFDVVGGHMVSVVENLANLSDDDRLAIAAYLKALSPSAP